MEAKSSYPNIDKQLISQDTNKKREAECKLCNNKGVVNEQYCSCDRGVFYESRDELLLQIEAGEKDIGL